jgi:hypothetical protein
MAKAAKSSNPHMKKMVALAHTLGKMHHKADGGGVKGDFSPSPRVAAERMSQPERIRARMGNGNPRLTQTMREMDMGTAQDIEDTVPRGGGN